MNNKLILTDCDGVLLSWAESFHEWMAEHGWEQKPNASHYYSMYDIYHGLDKENAKKFTKLFNESANIGFLPPFRDSMYYVRRLHEEFGYQFRVITSLSSNIHAGNLRRMNLEKYFGSAIESVICLDTGADKDEALEPYQYSGLYWIEDKFENAEAGHELGLSSILVTHGHNSHYETKYPRVETWKEIYQIIRAGE
jgi:FMN phosphatase YigB (HAD superfamily)